jgi:hypothetical protein
MQQVQLHLTELAELLFPSLELGLEEERAWAARNIVDYHCAECRVINSALAVAIKESDPEAKVFHVQIAGPENKIFILWRTQNWRDSKHRRLALKTSLALEKHQQDVLRADTAEELAHRKTCVEWLARVASKFCDICIGYKVSFLRDAFYKLASRANYDMDILYAALIEIVDEDSLKQVWVGAPQRKNKDEQRKPEEVQGVSEARLENQDAASKG